MPSCVLDCRVAVHVGQLAQAEPIVVLVAWVGEPVNDHRVVVGMVDLTNSAVQFVVSDGGPESWLLIFNLGKCFQSTSSFFSQRAAFSGSC